MADELRIPTIHANGTSKDVLFAAILEAGQALRTALEALAVCTPHGRDYYPQGETALPEALVQHRSREERDRKSVV